MYFREQNCCKPRTKVLSLGFYLIVLETCFCLGYLACRVEYELMPGFPYGLDLITLLTLYFINTLSNSLLIYGANKNYSAEDSCTTKWEFMIPWIAVYSCNLILYVWVYVITLHHTGGAQKIVAILPLMHCCCLMTGLVTVTDFTLEQSGKTNSK